MNGEAMEPHDVPMTVLGAGLLWFGWFGFNAGSALTAGGLAASAFTVTNIAAAAATITWVLASYAHPQGQRRRGRLRCGRRPRRDHAGVRLRDAGRRADHRSRRRRPVLQRHAPPRARSRSTTRSTSSPSTASAACSAPIATGIFASSTVQAAYSGLLDGNPQQLVTQVIAVGATIAYAAVGTFVIVKVVDLLLGMRVKPEVEAMGLDLSVHGEAAYQV